MTQERRTKHVHGHRSQFVERAVAVSTYAEIDLGETAYAEVPRNVDEQRDL